VARLTTIQHEADDTPFPADHQNLRSVRLLVGPVFTGYFFLRLPAFLAFSSAFSAALVLMI
jgi:hypothetical protein